MTEYPNLLRDGKIFPSWIVYKYNRYFDIPSTDDPCNGSSKRQLRTYQRFISKYLDYNSPFNSILLYHGVGSGKTATAIEVYNNLFRHTEYWNVIILIKSSLKNDWMNELNRWLLMDNEDKQHQMSNIHFLTYNSSVNWQHFQELQKRLDSTRKNLYIIDEVHNFIRTVYNSITNMHIGGCQQIYDSILREKRDNPTTRIIAISATPGINHPFEFALIFNLLRPDLFPTKEVDFNNIFLIPNKDITDEKVIIPDNKINMFQRRILGLVSYYDSSDPRAFAKKNIYNINVKITNYQKNIYDIFANIEAKYAAKSFSKKANKLYKVYTRNACNFVFPSIKNIDGTQRPRPNKFQLSDKEADKIMHAKENKELTTSNINNINKEKYLMALKLYIDTFKEYINELVQKDIKHHHTIYDDIKYIINEYNTTHKSINKILSKYVKKANISEVLKQLYTCSPKYVCMSIYSYISPGPVILYTSYVRMEGIEILKIYLEFLGFIKFDKDSKDTKYDYKRYVEYDGLIDIETRALYQNTFNTKDNSHGKIIKIILLSQAGSEGITLKNVRQIHIAEPHWNEALMQQVIGRGVRRCSHRDLPEEERVVDIYRYKLTYGKKSKLKTTDEYIYDIASNKEYIINRFLYAIKEAAVDCELNKANNIINNKDLKCFKFEESSLLTETSYPAYYKNIEDDQIINSGLHAINNELIDTTVYKINAVILEDKEKNIYSNDKQYWLNKETGAVYDYKYKFLVGRVKYDIINGEFIYDHDDNNNFIINYVVPYPDIIKNKKI